jgi:hypothetical protein
MAVNYNDAKIVGVFSAMSPGEETFAQVKLTDGSIELQKIESLRISLAIQEALQTETAIAISGLDRNSLVIQDPENFGENTA